VSGEVLVLSGSDITALMAPADYLEAARAAFLALAEGCSEVPPPLEVAGDGGTFHAKGASLRLDRLYVVLKLNGNFPANPETLGLPTIQGLLLLADGSTGAPLAVMDSAEVTLRRTAAATALAARHLAPPGCDTALVCGCGRQGEAQGEALRAVLPVRRWLFWDALADRASTLAEVFGGEAVTDLEAAARESRIIVTCTSARSPFLRVEWVRAGTFVAAVGADSPDKSEIEPALVGQAKLVVDSLDQCARIGDLRHGLAAGALRREDVHAPLHAIVSGAAPGRESAEEVILFDSTGLAVQDAAAAVAIFERAQAAGAGLAVALAA
jgi:ornithine cyclodeaminase/alanine dehydrogenase-like protein (mu-crystallin family)